MDRTEIENTVWAKPIEDQTTGRKRKPLVEVLRAELHTHEIAGANHNLDVVKYWSATWHRVSNDDEAWCAAFMNWCLKEAGLPHTGSPRALSFLNWGKKCKPHLGCLMVRDYGNGRGHVAILLDETETHYLIVGGNQANKVGADWWSKSGIWHARCLKKVMLSKTSIISLLKSAGMLGGGGYLYANKPVEPSIESPNGESTSPRMQEVDRVVEEIKSTKETYVVPEGYQLVSDKLIDDGFSLLLVLIVVSLGSNGVILKDRLKNIFNYGR